MAEPRRSAAPLVAAGILFSRLSGLIRQRVLAHFLGLTDAADAFAAAFRIPNFLQNLFGEGVLSASFIPVYARLVSQGRTREARQVAGAVAGLLGLVVGIIVALGVTFAPELTGLIARGFSGPKLDLAIRLVRILFPGIGFLVLSAWCLGILNSHRKFLLSYSAPVIWNAAIIAAAFISPGPPASDRIVIWVAWGAVAGGLLQFAIQLPAVFRLAGLITISLDRSSPEARTVIRNFTPAFLGRGVVQISAFLDAFLASLLPTGAMAALTNAQILYTLPVSLFGMSVAAAELPELAAAAAPGNESTSRIRARLEEGAAQIAFFIVPSMVALAALGHVVAGLVFQSGLFSGGDSRYVWGILAGSAVGLLAGTLGRLYASAWYAMHDARKPLRFAVVRVILTIGMGVVAALYAPGWIGVEARWGAAGITLASGLAAWVELALLRRSLDHRIGRVRLGPGYLFRLGIPAVAAAGTGWAILGLLGGRWGPVATGIAVLFPFGIVYLAGTFALRVPMALRLAGRLTPV